ncbi:hypothetical protein HYW31_00070 [Candidatus Berkelbacteria bacterium]|nr:hypothetical protein [Candidatus Berkelbacteria bacterium]
MKFSLRGNPNLSKWFILFLFLWAVFVGEILPVWMEKLEGTAGQPGAKESMFSGLRMFIPTVIIYSILGLFFWWLFRKLHWLIIVFIAIILGVAMEFLLFKPQETSGPNVAENPLGALIFFIIIWPILLVLPYLIFRGLSRLKEKFSKNTILGQE